MSADGTSADSAYDFSAWLGRVEETEDVVTASPVAGLAATLDHATPPWRAGEVPPLAHWLYCLPRVLQQDIAEDGHERRGGFLPPVPLPRRMWAGGTLVFSSPIRIGDRIRRRSTIAGIQHKSGRSGHLVFVKVVHETFGGDGLAVREEQDIVYREAAGDAPSTAANHSAPIERGTVPTADVPVAGWTRRVQPDAVMLFRYSALTFNAHRIHYDREYCRDREGYPGLVVHGPLTATLLTDLFLRNHPDAEVKAFRFRGQRPLFDTGALTLCGAARGSTASLWALDERGNVAMTAELETA